MKRFVSFLLILCLLPIFGIPPAGAAGPFTDIPDAATRQAAELLYRLKIVSGTGGSNYSPDRLFTRADLAVIGVRLSGTFDVSVYGGTVRFPDVLASHWAHRWINAATSRINDQPPVMVGSTDGLFHPNDPMLYGQLITVLMKLLGYKDEHVGLNWPYSYIAKAEALGTSRGMSFGADHKMTRGEAARLIYNFLFAEIRDGDGVTFMEKAFKAEPIETVLVFETDGGVTEIFHGDKTYTYRGTLDESYKGRLASMMADKGNNILSVALDQTVSYRQVTVMKNQADGLSLKGGAFIPVASSLKVWDWGGSSSAYDKAGDFWEEEPVTLAYRGNALLYIVRDSKENQIGTPYNTVLRMLTSGGQTYAAGPDGARYPVRGTIDAALCGRWGRLLVDRERYAVSFTPSRSYTYASLTVTGIQSNGLFDDKGGFIPISKKLPVWGETEDEFDDVWENIRTGEIFLLAYDENKTLQYIYRSLTRGSGSYKLAVLEKQPVKGVDPLTGAFGKTAEDAVLYKNGFPAERDMLERWDVLMFYESAGIVEAYSMRVSGYYTDPKPSPAAPSTLTMMGRTFELLPEATAKMPQFSGQRCVFLLIPDTGASGWRIADVRGPGEVAGTTIGLVTADNSGVLVGWTPLTLSGEPAGPYALMTGWVGHFQGSSGDRIYLTPFEPQSGGRGDLNVTAKRLGSVPLAPWCTVYEQVGSAGRAVRLSLSDIPMGRVPAAKVIHAETGSAGYVTAIVLNDVTGDAYAYGYADSKEEGGSSMSGEQYSYTVAGVSTTGGGVSEWFLCNSFTPPRKGAVIGLASGNALSGDGGVVTGLVDCIRYDGLTREDFNGNRSVTLKGDEVPVASALTGVYVPSIGEMMPLSDARVYCNYFDVYTDPWGYKVRLIIGRM
ncbi:MAG: S-layer homology domain-containing protein [Oscillospiraceae bacterium]|jgi:hypothetical protein|nr:S-layer homology domain-containing protein [Oscillospiraceae bacterium]